jgi:hypothetical protein
VGHVDCGVQEAPLGPGPSAESHTPCSSNTFWMRRRRSGLAARDPRPNPGLPADQLGPNALGEVLEPGRVADCYLGLLLPPPPAGEPEAGTILIVAPTALLHPGVPQPAGSLVYELVFVADLTVELRAWPNDTWTAVGVDPDQVTQAVVGCWQDGEVTGLQVDDLGLEEARSLSRPAMTYVRAQLRGRLTARLARAQRRWLHPTSGRQPGDVFP